MSSKANHTGQESFPNFFKYFILKCLKIVLHIFGFILLYSGKWVTVFDKNIHQNEVRKLHSRLKSHRNNWAKSSIKTDLNFLIEKICRFIFPDSLVREQQKNKLMTYFDGYFLTPEQNNWIILVLQAYPFHKLHLECIFSSKN